MCTLSCINSIHFGTQNVGGNGWLFKGISNIHMPQLIIFVNLCIISQVNLSSNYRMNLIIKAPIIFNECSLSVCCRINLIIVCRMCTPWKYYFVSKLLKVLKWWHIISFFSVFHGDCFLGGTGSILRFWCFLPLIVFCQVTTRKRKFWLCTYY